MNLLFWCELVVGTKQSKYNFSSSEDLLVQLLRMLPARDKERWHFLGKAQCIVGLLLCPMLMWVYYTSIDFLPCIPAIDRWIYHVNCGSAQSSEFMHWSMQHLEEDKETVQTSSWDEVDECWLKALFFLSLAIPIYLMLKPFSIWLRKCIPLCCQPSCWG